MPKFLEKINIEFISLVAKGANKKTVIFKTAGEAPMELSNVEFAKSDDVKQMVYGIVYSPGEEDAHGHQATEKEIELAAHGFMKNLRGLNIDKQHDFKPTGEAYVAENWIVRNGDPLFGAEKPGSWAVGIKIESADLYEEARKNLHGLSMAGRANVVTKAEGENGMIKKLLKMITNKEQGADEMDEKEVRLLINEAIVKAAEGAAKPLTEEAMATVLKTAVGEMLKPITERLEKIEKTSPGTKQDEDDSTEDVQKQIDMGIRIAKMASATKDGEGK